MSWPAPLRSDHSEGGARTPFRAEERETDKTRGAESLRYQRCELGRARPWSCPVYANIKRREQARALHALSLVPFANAYMNPCHEYLNHLTRRQFFAGAGLALGGVALNWLAPRVRAAGSPMDALNARVHPPLPGFPHFAPTAKRIIYLHMNGGPSQLDTFDYKPGLREHFDIDLPESIRMGQRITTMTSGQTRFPVAPSIFKFEQYGRAARG